MAILHNENLYEIAKNHKLFSSKSIDFGIFKVYTTLSVLKEIYQIINIKEE